MRRIFLVWAAAFAAVMLPVSGCDGTTVDNTEVVDPEGGETGGETGGEPGGETGGETGGEGGGETGGEGGEVIPVTDVNLLTVAGSC